MPTAVTFTRNVTINSSSQNGKLSANWTCSDSSRSTNPPALSKSAGDQIAVKVTDSNNNPATSFKLYAIVSPNLQSGASDVAASPFQGASNQAQAFFNQTLNATPFQYTFPAVKTLGNYELTYVIETNGNQFSEDPEFDVET